jgi:glycosyltransferase involved in cell wall biosynthesis
MKLVILIPAYNEEGTIKQVLKEIPKSFDSISETEIIVIDDGSTDNTAKLAKEHGASVYSFTQNQGLAKAISHGFSKCLEHKADLLVILDADMQYDSREIPLLLKPIIEEKADIILGDRQVKKLDHMPLQKRIGNQMSSKMVSRLMGQKINDAQTGFRAFNRNALNKLHIFSYTYTQETLLQAKFKGLKIVEVPVTFRKRADKSRLISNIFSYAIRTVSLLASTIIFYKSFKFFGILTVILFGIGIGLSVFLLNHFYTTGQISPYYPTTMLTAIFLITAAISALMTIISSIMNRQSTLLEEINQILKEKNSSKV